MPKRSKCKAMIIPPPVKGWNTRDPLIAMDPQYAVEMENFFPGFGSVDLRKGSVNFSFLSNPGVGLGTFKYGSYDKLICTETTTKLVTDISTSTETDITGAFSTNGPFVYFQQFRDRVFLTTGTGLDDIAHWTGTGNIAASGFTGPGGDDKQLGPMTSYKNRLYFAHRTTSTTGNLEFWYGGVDAITGALTQYDLSSIFKSGGYISFLGSVTRAKDYAEDELLAVISSEGEILLYQGSYPGDSTWGLVGRYFVPKPLGPRAFFYLGSTLMILTRQGVFPMDTIMGGSFSTSTANAYEGDISSVIKSAFSQEVIDAYLGDYRWCGVNYPKGNFLIINVPTGAATAVQFVMNTITGAWCKFTGLNASSWVVYQDNLYFTSSDANVVMKADYGYADEVPGDPVPTEINPRTIKLWTAYNGFDDPAIEKQFVSAIPYIYMSEGFQLTMDIDVNYNGASAGQIITPDNSDTSYKLYTPKIGLRGYGEVGSMRIDGTVTTKRMSLQAIKVLWNEGDVI